MMIFEFWKDYQGNSSKHFLDYRCMKFELILEAMHYMYFVVQINSTTTYKQYKKRLTSFNL